MADTTNQTSSEELGYGSQFKGSQVDAAVAAMRGVKIFQVTVPKSGWSNGAVTVSDENILAAGIYAYIVSPVSSDFEQYVSCVIRADDIAQDGKITFHAEDTLESDMTVSILMLQVVAGNGTTTARVFNAGGGGGGSSSSFELASITIKTPPTKTTYKSGESFDPTGMEVTATYTNGLSFDVAGYSYDPQVLTDGVTKVVISYAEGKQKKTANQAVAVTPVLSSIKIGKNPNKTTYEYLESFSSTGMTITGVYTDGSEKTVTDWTTPSTQFTTLGDKTVEVSYTEDGITKTCDVNVTVNAIKLTIPTQSGTLTYDGSDKQPSFSNWDGSKMNISGNTAKNAGDYEATLTTVYGYVWTDGTDSTKVSWTINRAEIAVPTQDGALIYDGTNKQPSWTGYDSTKMDIGGVLQGVDAKTYVATFTPKANYQWPDGTHDTKNVNWVITSVVVPLPTQNGTLTYSGSSQQPTFTYDSDHSTVSATAQTNAGDYKATAHLLAGVWPDGTTEDKEVDWSIKRQKIAAVPTQSGTLTYDGSEKSPSWSGYDSVKMTESATKQVHAGSYKSTFTPTSNYCWDDDGKDFAAKEASWSIQQATVSLPTQNGSLTFNNSAQSPSWTGYESAKMTKEETSQTNAGTYTTYFTPTSDYKWADTGTSARRGASWTIGPADNSVTCNPTSLSLTADASSKAFTVSRLGSGTITAKSSNESIATVSVSGTQVTVNAVASGNCTISVEVAAAGNYKKGTASVSVSAELYPATLAECTPAQIQSLSKAGTLTSLYPIGSKTKELTLNGSVKTAKDGTVTFSNLAIAMILIGYDHNKDKENPTAGDHVAHFQIGWRNNHLTGLYGFQMNSSNTNAGGWNGSMMKSKTLVGTGTPSSPTANTLMALIPAEWRAVMRSVTKYTDNTGGGSDTASYVTATTEYLCPLAEFEYFGTRAGANSAEQNYQKQYQYYADGNAKVHYRHDTDAANFCWERSPLCSYSTYFRLVDYDGSSGGDYASGTIEVAPVLFI